MEKYSLAYQDFSHIECIFFDLDNTLIETRKADVIACEKIANQLRDLYHAGCEEAKIITTNFLKNFRKCPDNPSLTLEKWRTRLWTDALGEKFKQYSSAIYKSWLSQRYHYLSLSHEIISLLENLRKQYRIGLITNGTSAAQWEKIDKLNLNDCFDLILVSGDLPHEKPNKNIFFEACAQLKISPGCCLMVGDKLETDIQGGLNAKLAGTVWIPLENEYSLSESDPHPDIILDSVLDLKGLLHESSFDDVEMDLDMYSSFVPLNKNRLFSNVFPMDEDSNSNGSDGS